MRIFVDSDVVISSLISSTGAAHALLSLSAVSPIISSHSYRELSIVVERLHLEMVKLNEAVEQCEVISLQSDLTTLQREYAQFVTDENDAHVIAGAHLAKVQFLVSYNLKHFKLDKIKGELDIVVLPPARFLQYLRSQ